MHATKSCLLLILSMCRGTVHHQHLWRWFCQLLLQNNLCIKNLYPLWIIKGKATIIIGVYSFENSNQIYLMFMPLICCICVLERSCRVYRAVEFCLPPCLSLTSCLYWHAVGVYFEFLCKYGQISQLCTAHWPKTWADPYSKAGCDYNDIHSLMGRFVCRHKHFLLGRKAAHQLPSGVACTLTSIRPTD